MPQNAREVEPRHFFLNEQHELARGERRGGGRIPEYVGVNWRAKGVKLSSSLRQVRDRLRTSRDPLRGSRYFVLARPETQLAKKSEDKRRAQGGQVLEAVVYSAAESRVFGRLGMDLIQVNPDGSATVHARPDRFEQLLHSSTMLDEFSRREKARWATLDSFELVPAEFVFDQEWLSDVTPKRIVDALVELQPLLTAVEADDVSRAIATQLQHHEGEGLHGVGTDFSGRKWLRARLTRDSILRLAKSFFSIQSIHPPLYAVFHASQSSKTVRAAAPSRPRVNPLALPCVAVLDTGVPTDHLLLGAYRRGQYLAPTSVGAPAGNHGSMVTSRVVFGEIDCEAGTPANPRGECSFYDVNIALDDRKIDEKSVLPALDAIVGVAPDVRVFNLCFDNVRPLDAEPPVQRREKLILVQELDNFIFRSDVLVVVAAGNSEPGIQPATPYPRHFTDPQWAMGTWPRSFNALTCGSFSLNLHADGVAAEVGAPSPFCRVGPGLCNSPKPDLSDHGGNSNANYQFQRGLGVWGCSAAGLWEDGAGTSFAAPLLARQAALALRSLQDFCEPGTHPFAVTAKAYLSISAVHHRLGDSLHPLADVTLGRGQARSNLLQRARQDRAMLLWQGILDGPADVARVQIPVPRDWLTEATAPRLRLIFAWDSPVNAAVEQLWGSRKVTAQFRVRLDGPALRGSGTGHRTYPLVERVYDLHRVPDGVKPIDDLWLLEFSYEQTAEYYPAFDFNPRQRLAFAAELYDESEEPLSPQSMLQALPIVASMNRFSIGSTVIRNPIVLKNRV